MPLTIELKPGERIILGEYVITNTERTRLVFHNENITILREKDILAPEQANTPAKRLYFAIQQMYVSKNSNSQREIYLALSSAILQAVPSARLLIENINSHIVANNFYKALKEARKLIEYEQQCIGTVEEVLHASLRIDFPKATALTGSGTARATS